MSDQHDYLFLTAGLSPAAVGVHARAAAMAAAGRTGGLVPRTELAASGMDDGLERELLEAGLLRLAGGDVLLVAVEPLTQDAIVLADRRAAHRANQKRHREKAASSEVCDHACSHCDHGDHHPQDAGLRDVTGPPASPTRARTAAAVPPLLNVLTSREGPAAAAVAPAREAPASSELGRVRALLASVFSRPDDPALADSELLAAIETVRSQGNDPIEVALEVVAVEQRERWRTRSAGAVMAIASRGLLTRRAKPAGAAARSGRSDREARRLARQAERAAIARGEIADPSPFSEAARS